MAYAVDWIAKIVVIPASDLILISGTRYRLNMASFLAECRRLEWAFADGFWAEPILQHTDALIDFAGANYAGFDKIINGYVIQFSAPATRVDLLGSNNDIIDVLIVNGISVVPSNSAGLQVVSSGSGLDAVQDTKLTEVHRAHFNKRAWDKTGNTVTIFDADGITVLHVFDTNSDLSEITPQ